MRFFYANSVPPTFKSDWDHSMWQTMCSKQANWTCVEFTARCMWRMFFLFENSFHPFRLADTQCFMVRTSFCNCKIDGFSLHEAKTFCSVSLCRLTFAVVGTSARLFRCMPIEMKIRRMDDEFSIDRIRRHRAYIFKTFWENKAKSFCVEHLKTRRNSSAHSTWMNYAILFHLIIN